MCGVYYCITYTSHPDLPILSLYSTLPLSFYASNDSSWRVFCVVGLFACTLYLTAYCLLCVSVPVNDQVKG